MKSKSTIQRTLRAVLSGTAVLAGVIIATAPANATSISILNGNFEAVPVPDWYWVPDWDEGGASYVQAAPGLGSGRCLYMDAGGWVSQNLSYNWTAGEVFTLGIKGNQGWRAGGSFKIQLREADGTVLWDSGTTSVNSTTQNFSWSIDSSTFSGTGESLQMPYEAWSGGNGFNTLNGEGIAYGMAWLLGAPTNSSTSIGLLPKASYEAGKLVVEFTCLKVAKRGTAVLKLQSSKDLGLTDLWTDHEVVVPDTAGTVGSVTFSVPTTNANPDLTTSHLPHDEAGLQPAIDLSPPSPGRRPQRGSAPGWYAGGPWAPNPPLL